MCGLQRELILMATVSNEAVAQYLSDRKCINEKEITIHDMDAALRDKGTGAGSSFYAV